jgi:antitoxin Phd
MKTISANELKQSTGRAMDQALRQPVVVEKHGRPHVVMLSHEDFQDYERLKYAALKEAIREGIESGDSGVLDPEELIAEIDLELAKEEGK